MGLWQPWGCTGAATSPTPTSSCLTPLCTATFSRCRGSQHPIPVCLPSSHCSAAKRVENLSPPDISQGENCHHCYHLAVAITSPVGGLLDSPILCKAAALWGSANVSGQRDEGTGGQDPAGTGRLLPSLVLGMLSYNLTCSSGDITG